jgi:hypothetical protein
MKKLIIAFAAVLLLTSCAALDVVQTDAIRAFRKIPTTDTNAILMPDKSASINWDSNNTYIKIEQNGEELIFSSENGGNTAEEIISRNRSALTYNAETEFYTLAIGKATFSWPKVKIDYVIFEWETPAGDEYSAGYQL